MTTVAEAPVLLFVTPDRPGIWININDEEVTEIHFFYHRGELVASRMELEDLYDTDTLDACENNGEFITADCLGEDGEEVWELFEETD